MKKKRRKLNKKGKILVGCLYVLAFILIGCSILGYLMGPVSKKDSKNQLIIIETGDTYSSIASVLKEQKLIRSELTYKLYVKLNNPKESLKAGRHYLRSNMTLKELVTELGSSPSDHDVITLTFKEGVNVRRVASIIAENTNYSEDDVYNLLKDTDFLNRMIQKYWFLTDEIKNSNIYYSLEGYLYPNTYEFSKKSSLEDMIVKMLDETDAQLSKYKQAFEKSEYSIHQILTVASMSELEAFSEKDREGIARVFYNRLDAGMSLGSDVTAYYAAGVTIGERDLYQTELDDVNAYNTRSSSMAGKLPVGPVCNPSIISIKTAIQPKDTDYLYFISDKNKKVYFTKTDAEHNAMIQKLINEGLWYTYDN